MPFVKFKSNMKLSNSWATFTQSTVSRLLRVGVLIIASLSDVTGQSGQQSFDQHSLRLVDRTIDRLQPWKDSNLEIHVLIPTQLRCQRWSCDGPRGSILAAKETKPNNSDGFKSKISNAVSINTR